MEIMPNKIVKKGQIVFSEGDSPDGVYYITQGRVQVNRMINGISQTIAELEEGDIFGELAMIDDSPRSATIIATEDTWLYTLQRKIFEQKLKALDHLMYTVFLRMALCIKNMNLQIENLNRLAHHTLTQEAIAQAQNQGITSEAAPTVNLSSPFAQTSSPEVDTTFIHPTTKTNPAPADNLSMIEDYINQPRFK